MRGADRLPAPRRVRTCNKNAIKKSKEKMKQDKIAEGRARHFIKGKKAKCEKPQKTKKPKHDKPYRAENDGKAPNP